MNKRTKRILKALIKPKLTWVEKTINKWHQCYPLWSKMVKEAKRAGNKLPKSALFPIMYMPRSYGKSFRMELIREQILKGKIVVNVSPELREELLSFKTLKSGISVMDIGEENVLLNKGIKPILR